MDKKGNEKSLIDWNENTEIFRWGPIPGKYFYMSEFMNAIFLAYPKESGHSHRWPQTLLLAHKNRIVWLNDNKEVLETAQAIFNKIVLPNGAYKKYLPLFNQSILKLEKQYSIIDTGKISQFSKNELISFLSETENIIYEFWMSTIDVELGAYGSSAILQKKLIEFGIDKKKIADVMEVLTAPEEITFYQEEELKLLKTDNIKKHSEKYIWIENSYEGIHLPDKEIFLERKKDLESNLEEKVLRKIENSKKRKELLKEQYNLSEEIMNISYEIINGISFQDKRKAEIFRLQHYKFIFLREVSQRTGIQIETLEQYSFSSLVKFLSGDVLPQVRGDYFGIFAFTDTIENLSEDLAKAYWGKFANEKVKSNMQEFSGTIASKGSGKTIKAKVRIVLNSKEIDNFESGDVLVAPMTSPEYVTLMKKASAIITDTGGLTSHAAIVSRELQVPCIVGTKFATQVLHDGDLVEVDANRGVVKVLKRKRS